MVEEKKYTQILSDGLMLDHYFILCSIKNGDKLNSSKRIMGFLNLLNKKGYIKDDHLTQKAIDLIETCPQCVPPPEVAKKVDYFHYDTWAKELYRKCQDKLKELTGSTQVQAKIERTTYSFLCNEKDFARNISKVIVAYKLEDEYERIESTIMRFITKCSREKNWFPLMKYYILKRGESQMVTDLSDLTPEDNDTSFKSNQKFI